MRPAISQDRKRLCALFISIMDSTTPGASVLFLFICASDVLNRCNRTFVSVKLIIKNMAVAMRFQDIVKFLEFVVC